MSLHFPDLLHSYTTGDRTVLPVELRQRFAHILEAGNAARPPSAEQMSREGLKNFLRLFATAAGGAGGALVGGPPGAVIGAILTERFVHNTQEQVGLSEGARARAALEILQRGARGNTIPANEQARVEHIFDNFALDSMEHISPVGGVVERIANVGRLLRDYHDQLPPIAQFRSGSHLAVDNFHRIPRAYVVPAARYIYSGLSSIPHAVDNVLGTFTNFTGQALDFFGGIFGKDFDPSKVTQAKDPMAKELLGVIDKPFSWVRNFLDKANKFTTKLAGKKEVKGNPNFAPAAA